MSALHKKLWRPADSGRDEHFNRSADCAFFTLVNSHKQIPTPKRTKSKKGRASRVSRLSSQSAHTVASDAASIADLPTEEGDSILTTATNATVTTQNGKKTGKVKKPAAAKGRKTKAKKDEAIEVQAPEPEDADFEVKVQVAPKPTRGRKRKTDEAVDFDPSVIESQPPPKRRATRTRASTVVDGSTIINPDETVQSVAAEDAPKLKGRKNGRSSVARSTRKASAASFISAGVPIPNDDEIDAALEADLERRLTDDEVPTLPLKKTRADKVTKAEYNMFATEPMEIDDAAIESELQAMEAESKHLPKAKGAKGKQTRKVSAKQQAAARKAVEAEAAAETKAQRHAEEEASQQIVAELEHSLLIHVSPPIVQSKRQRTTSCQPSRQVSGRKPQGSVMSVNESTVETNDEFHDATDDQKDDSGDETDASMASQSTIVRRGSTRRGSTTKKGRGGKNTTSRNIEEIVRKPKDAAPEIEGLSLSVVPEFESMQVDESTGREEAFYTPAPEAPALVEEPLPKAPQAAPKSRGRPAKAALAPKAQEVYFDPESEAPIGPEATSEEQTQITTKTAKGKEVAPRSPTPRKETTPIESPQSSDAENHPPSSKPSTSARKPITPHAASSRIPLAASTPAMSPSKRNVIAGFQSSHPWTAVDLDAVFMKSPGDENSSAIAFFGERVLEAKNGGLTSTEKKMTVEEWIHYNAEVAEEKLRGECERMVGVFEQEGLTAMRALEGVECAE